MDATQPSWSCDGKLIAYTESGARISVIDPFSSPTDHPVNSNTSAIHAVWSPINPNTLIILSYDCLTLIIYNTRDNTTEKNYHQR